MLLSLMKFPIGLRSLLSEFQCLYNLISSFICMYILSFTMLVHHLQSILNRIPNDLFVNNKFGSALLALSWRIQFKCITHLHY